MQKLLGKILLATYVLAMFFAVPQLAKAWPAQYADWDYRQLIFLGDTTTIPNYQVKITLNATDFDYSHAQADGDDIRFTDSTDHQANYWIESWNNTGNSVIWVEVPSSGTTAVYVYYGNSAATSESVADDVFLLYDDFTGSSLAPGKWIETTYNANSSITVSGGVVDLSMNPGPGGGYAMLTSVDDFGPNIIMEARAIVNCGGMNNYGYMPMWNPGSNPYSPSIQDLIQIGDGAEANNNYLSAFRKQGNQIIDNGASLLGSNTWENYKIIWTTSIGQIYVTDGTTFGDPLTLLTHTNDAFYLPTVNLQYAFVANTRQGEATGHVEHEYLDWVKIRAYDGSFDGSELPGLMFDEEQLNDYTDPNVISESTTVSATVPSSLTFTINPITSGQTVNGATANLATTSGDQVDFGSFAGAGDKIAAHDLVVSTNATNGYQVMVKYDHYLSSASDYIPDFTGTNASPVLWTVPPGSGINGYFGYTTNDSSLYSSLNNRFVSNKWAGFYSDYAEVAYHDGVVENQATRVGYRLQITSLQAAGNYSNHLVYLCTATY